MVATIEQTAVAGTKDSQPGCGWRMFDHYSTLECAESKLSELTSAGFDARLSLIDGLSIIVRRESRISQH